MAILFALQLSDAIDTDERNSYASALPREAATNIRQTETHVIKLTKHRLLRMLTSENNKKKRLQRNPPRVRKGVSSFSVVSFKRKDRNSRNKNKFPSNWAKFSLYCKTGWLLQVLPNGVVNGTRDTKSQHAVLQIQVLTPTLLRFKGVASGRYIGINAKGRLVSKKYPTKETVFQEEVLENSYRTFNSAFHPKLQLSDWYMGIRKNGSPKKASRTKVGEKYIQFLKLPFSSGRHI
eukprot:gene5271-5937_t